MSKMNEWAVQHVENIEDAVYAGATNLEEVVEYCCNNMEIIDISYIEEYLEANWDGYLTEAAQRPIGLVAQLDRAAAF